MNTENNYQATDLGNISPNPRGDYAASASYEYLDLVNMDGGSYICLAELGTTVTGVSPEPGKTTETWQCIALPGDLTPEYIAMHDDVVNKAESVAEDTEKVTEMHENVTGMESNVQELQKQAAQSAEEAEASKDAAAGYARAADASRQAAEEAEANVNAQVTGFDSHVAEKTEESERAIAEARQAAVEVVHTATNTATDAAERAGRAASTAEEAKTAAAGSETNAAASASAAKTSETNAKTSEEAAKEAMQAAQDAAAGVAADREQITANKEGIAALKKTKSSAIVQTATGTSIVAQDSSDDPVRGLRVFGRTTQDGTPTPDAPVPLVSAGDSGSVKIGVYGSNLLDYEQWKKVNVHEGTGVWENNGVTLTATSKDCYTAYSKVTNTTSYRIPCNPGETYILTWEHTGNESDWVYVFYNEESNNNKRISSKYGQLEFTIPEDCTFFTFRVGCYIAGTTSHYKNVRLSIKDARDFEPYTHQSLTLQTPNGLPGIPVTDASLANYTDADGQMWCSDEVDLERGVYVQRVLLNKLDSDGNWRFSTSTGRFYCIDKRFMCAKVNNDYHPDAFCSHFSKCGHVSSTGFNDLEFGLINNADHGFAFRYDALNGDIDAWKTFLNEKDVYVLGVLVSPIETPLTESELSAYQSLHSNYLVTTVLNDVGAHMEFSYNADSKNYIAAEHAKMEAAFDAKLAEIIALLPAETQAAMIENETTNLLNESEE